MPNRTIGEESKHHQKLAYALLSVVLMRLGQVRDQGLASLTEVIWVGWASSLALVFGVANAALFADANRQGF